MRGSAAAPTSASLRRTRSGPFTEDQALPASLLEREAEEGIVAERLIAPVNALGYPVCGSPRPRRPVCGRAGEIPAPDSPITPGTRLAALEPGGTLLAIVEARPGRMLQPVRVIRGG